MKLLRYNWGNEQITWLRIFGIFRLAEPFLPIALL
jgi:hypothetical protein